MCSQALIALGVALLVTTGIVLTVVFTTKPAATDLPEGQVSSSADVHQHQYDIQTTPALRPATVDAFVKGRHGAAITTAGNSIIVRGPDAFADAQAIAIEAMAAGSVDVVQIVDSSTGAVVFSICHDANDPRCAAAQPAGMTCREGFTGNGCDECAPGRGGSLVDL